MNAWRLRLRVPNALGRSGGGSDTAETNERVVRHGTNLHVYRQLAGAGPPLGTRAGRARRNGNRSEGDGNESTLNR